MGISMFNCDVSQTLFVINSAAVSFKIINSSLIVFLNIMICWSERINKYFILFYWTVWLWTCQSRPCSVRSCLIWSTVSSSSKETCCPSLVSLWTNNTFCCFILYSNVSSLNSLHFSLYSLDFLVQRTFSRPFLKLFLFFQYLQLAMATKRVTVFNAYPYWRESRIWIWMRSICLVRDFFSCVTFVYSPQLFFSFQMTSVHR
jgi:hypothetical protein